MAVKKRAEQPDARRHGAHPRELGFRGPQVCSIVGITYRQLDYWARTDLVRPSIADARGERHAAHATRSRTSSRLKVVKSLLDAGVKLQTARQAIDYLREDLGDDWATANLVLDGTNSVLARTDDMLIDLVRRGQGVLNIVPLGHVMEELDAGVREHVAEMRVRRREADIPRSDPGRCRSRSRTSRCASRTTRNGSSRSCSTSTRSTGSTSRARSCSSATARATRRRRSRPDFYLPAYDLYIEITTLNQKLVTKKNRKARRLRRAVPRRADQGALPARLPAAAREVRARTAVAARRRAPARRSRSTSFPEPRRGRPAGPAAETACQQTA